MKSWVRVILVGLFTYRVSHLLMYDDGPKNVILQWRVGLDPKSQAGKWIQCPYCVSVWVAALGAALFFLPARLSDPILLWWGAAGFAELLENRNAHAVR